MASLRRQKTLFYFNTAVLRKSIVKNRKRRKDLKEKEKAGKESLKNFKKEDI